MNLAIICNKHLTIPFLVLARQLEKLGHNCVFLSPSRRWASYLINQGIDANSILCLPDHAARWHNLSDDKAREILAPFETDPSLTASHAILMCRGLKRRDGAFARAYLAISVQKIDEFFGQHKIDAVIGEGTWGFELAVAMVGKKHNIPVLYPCATRIPSERMGLVDSVSGALFAPKKASDADIDAARTFLANWRTAPRQPAYAVNTHGYVDFESRWLEEVKIALFQPEMDRDDETLWRFMERLGDRLTRTWRARQFSGLLAKMNVVKSADAGAHILVALQHQPESAVDVYGGFHSNQFGFIERLARMLPSTHKILVREHKAAIGDRPMGWYKALAKLPSVQLADPYEPIYNAIKAADAVLSVSGTVTYEAAILGIPALALAEVHFAPLLAVPPTRMIDPLAWPIRDILDQTKRSQFVPDDEKIIGFLAKLWANSDLGDVAAMAPPANMAQSDWLMSEAAFISAMLTR